MMVSERVECLPANRNRGRAPVQMAEDELQNCRKKLEHAINEALTDCPHINEAIQGIRESGYDVFLIVEATIGFNRRDGSLSQSSLVRLELTTQDEKFLRSLKISPE